MNTAFRLGSISDPSRSTAMSTARTLPNPPTILEHRPMTAKAHIIRGRPIPFVDTLGSVMSTSNKLILLSPQVESHLIDPQLEEVATDFIRRHQLGDVCVRLNAYAPMDELVRLLANDRVNIFLRLTLGMLHWFVYVTKIGRLVGGDHYNPFSNTVNVYSSHEGILAHELGHALDFRRMKYPGLYALARYVPMVTLYQEYKATQHAISFFRERGASREELRAYRILVPAYATYLAGGVVDLIPSPIVNLAFWPFILIGHVVGRILAATRHAALGGVSGTGFRLSKLGQEDRKTTVALYSPRFQRGRDFWGVLIGLVLGMILFPAIAFVTAALGMIAARAGLFGGRDPKALPAPKTPF